MNMIPRYNFLPGTGITLFERPMVVTGNSDRGYKVAGRDDGITALSRGESCAPTSTTCYGRTPVSSWSRDDHPAPKIFIPSL